MIKVAIGDFEEGGQERLLAKLGLGHNERGEQDGHGDILAISVLGLLLGDERLELASECNGVFAAHAVPSGAPHPDMTGLSALMQALPLNPVEDVPLPSKS